MLNTLFNRLVAGAPSDDHFDNGPKDPPAFGDVPPDPGLTPTEPPAPDFGDTPPDPGAIEPEPEPARLKKPEPPTREQRHLAAMHSAESEAWDRELERRSAPDVVPEC